MRTSFRQNLMMGSSRPIITNLYGGLALVDTGAEIPVCTLPPFTLKEVFHAERKITNTPIIGFGGEDVGDVYLLKEFRFKELVFPEMPVFLPHQTRNLQFRWILSASMFDQLEYVINMKNHIMTVNVPDDESLERRLRIYDKEGRLHVLLERV